MKSLLLLTLVLILTTAGFSQPGVTHIEVTDEWDFKLALDFAMLNNVDSIILTTSGGLYRHGIAESDT